MTEDCKDEHCYGYRSNATHPDDLYDLPDRKSGCRYANRDYAGFQDASSRQKLMEQFPTLTLEVMFSLRFLHNIVDVCQDPPELVRSEYRLVRCYGVYRGGYNKPVVEKFIPDKASLPP